MGGALLKGWAARGIGPVVAVDNNPSPALKAFANKHHVALFPTVANIDTVRARACVVALKPQILKDELASLKPVAQSGALMLSIAAGTSLAAMRKAWGRGARILRDYYDVELNDGGIYRLFHDLRADRWYLDARYD